MAVFIPAAGEDQIQAKGETRTSSTLDRMGYYALNMDAFPALVIYLSLLALAADNSLWQFHNGKNLIFTAEDYLAPRATPLWKALARVPDKRIAPLLTALADMCATPIDDLPPLSQVTAGQFGSPVAADLVALVLTDRGKSPQSQAAANGGTGR